MKMIMEDYINGTHCMENGRYIIKEECILWCRIKTGIELKAQLKDGE